MRRSIPLLFLLLCAVAPAHAAGGSGHTVITNIAYCIVGASLLGFLAKSLRLPLILGHLLAGIAIGPLGMGVITDEAEIRTVAQIGLILLLFMIGLEIDLRSMFSSGRLVLASGLLQFPASVAFGYALFALARLLGWDAAPGPYGPLYLAVAVSISSTMIVVKLLQEKRELDTLPGRITLGILVFQDLWAIVVLALQPNLADPRIGGILRTFASGALLIGAALAASKYILPRVFRSVAKVPELMLVLSLGWCFLVALVAAHPRVGLSMEMGALIAGVALATFPYNLDVIGKVITIRDFFVTLFFVALGMQIPRPEGAAFAAALVASLVCVATRFAGVFGVLYAMRSGIRTALLPTINLAQISEFSLVILSFGVGFGHIDARVLSDLIVAFSIMAVVSTLLIGKSHPIAAALGRGLRAAGLPDLGDAAVERAKAKERPVVFLGFFRVASSFLDHVRSKHQHLLEEVMVIDLNPESRRSVEAAGVPYLYGDVAHAETLHHAEIQHAKMVVCTIPDSLLKGTSNLRLLRTLKKLCPQAGIVVTSETPEDAERLYGEGAAYVLQPFDLAGASLVSVVDQALREGLAGMREEAIAKIREDASPSAS